MFSYKAHGLSIQSQIKFPELKGSNSDHEVIDVAIIWGEIDSGSKDIISEGTFRITTEYKITPESVYLIWENKEICEIINGNKIVVNPRTGLEDNFLRTLILGPALGILLHQKGRLVLHASSVDINGAVAFMGHNGMGKSTTTLALHHQGYPFVADDILSIEFDAKGTPIVFPGFPRIKVWPETIKLFDKDVDKYSPIISTSEKRSYFIHSFSEDPLPLKNIYIIENNEQMQIKSLNPQNSLIELLRNSYCASIFQSTDQAHNLKEYADIVRKVPVKILNVVRSLEKIPELVEIVENDLK